MKKIWRLTNRISYDGRFICLICGGPFNRKTFMTPKSHSCALRDEWYRHIDYYAPRSVKVSKMDAENSISAFQAAWPEWQLQESSLLESVRTIVQQLQVGSYCVTPPPSGYGGAVALFHHRFAHTKCEKGILEAYDTFHIVVEVTKENASLFKAVQALRKK